MDLYIFLLIIIPAVWIVLEIWLILRDRSRGLGKTARDQGTRCLNFMAIGVGITAAALLSGLPKFIFPPGRTIPVFFLGIALMLGGMTLRYWSIITLGQAFRTTVETHHNQKMITHGPYKFIRHPSYSGWLLICCGYGVAVQNWLSLLTAVMLPLAALIYRIRVEEAVLVASFGSDYLEYQKRSKKLIPWIW